jgi:hypothetical protein
MDRNFVIKVMPHCFFSTTFKAKKTANALHQWRTNSWEQTEIMSNHLSRFNSQIQARIERPESDALK